MAAQRQPTRASARVFFWSIEYGLNVRLARDPPEGVGGRLSPTPIRWSVSAFLKVGSLSWWAAVASPGISAYRLHQFYIIVIVAIAVP